MGLSNMAVTDYDDATAAIASGIGQARALDLHTNMAAALLGLEALEAAGFEVSRREGADDPNYAANEAGRWAEGITVLDCLTGRLS